MLLTSTFGFESETSVFYVACLDCYLPPPVCNSIVYVSVDLGFGDWVSASFVLCCCTCSVGLTAKKDILHM